jgi:hypothetical protein
MNLELFLQREKSERATTFGLIAMNDFAPTGLALCQTLEDQVREPIGWRDGIADWEADTLAKAVQKWKVARETAIPAGRYPLTLEDSKRFGPGTITINGVPGFSAIRIHGGTDHDDTEGCILVGDKQDREAMTISGAKFHHVLDRLKARVGAAITEGSEVWITIRNPTGAPADEA